MAASNGLKLEVRVPFAQCVDFKTADKRNGQDKWIQRGDMCVLNPKYPLSMDERDMVNYHFMMQLFQGNQDMMKEFYTKDPVENPGFSKDEMDFLASVRNLYDRLMSQSNSSRFDAKFPHARDWLIAHGIKPAAIQPDIEAQANALQRCDFTDESVLKLFHEDNARTVLEATGVPAAGMNKKAMLEMYCKRVLHDDPNRPVELADFSSAVFVLESWKSIQRALFEGVGSKPKITVTKAELQAQLRALNLPWDLPGDTLSKLWRRLNMHVSKRASRASIQSWFKGFDFELSSPVTQYPIDFKTVSKRVLFDMIGQFLTGTVAEICDDNVVHETAAFKFTSDSTMRSFLQKAQVWKTLTPDDRDNKEAMFRLYCAEKILKHGFIYKDATVLAESAIKAPESPEDLIDELLEQGVWATMVLSACQKQRIEKLLKIDTTSPQFSSLLRNRLRPYLTEEFLWSWLKLYHSGVLRADTSPLEEYVQANLCKRGVQVNPNQQPVISGNSEIDAKITSWTSSYSHPVAASAEEFKDVAVCQRQAQDPLEFEADYYYFTPSNAGDGAQFDKLEFRKRRVKLFFELINSLYMVSPQAPSELYDTYIKKVIDQMLVAKLWWRNEPTTADEKKLIVSDFNLWLEGMASKKVLELLLAARDLDRSKYRGDNLLSMLRAIAESNYNNFALINGWAKRQEVGELCWKGDVAILQSKLRLLNVPLVDTSGEPLSEKRMIYAYMHLLDQHLPDGEKLRLLSDEDYRKAMEDKEAASPFASCFSRYCQRFNASQKELALIVQFDPNQAGSVLLSWSAAAEIAHDVPRHRAAQLMQNQGVGCSKKIVTEADLAGATIVELVSATKRRILSQEKGEVNVEHYLVSLNGETIEYMKPIFDPLWEVVAFFQANGEFVHRIGDQIFAQ